MRTDAPNARHNRSKAITRHALRPASRTKILMAAGLSSIGVLSLSQHVKAADLIWTNQTGTANWDLTTPNWSGQDWVNGSTANFIGAAGQATQSINVVSNTSNGPTLSAFGLNFTTNAAINSSGYTLTSNTPGSGSTPGNTLYLATTNGTTPVINVNYAGPNNGGNGVLTPASLQQISDVIGQFQSQPALLPLPQPAQTPDNLALGGNQGFVLNGGSALVLANPITLTGGITLNSGSTLVVGSFPVTNSSGGVTSTVIPTPILNNNALTLNSANYYVNTQNSVFSATNPIQYVGPITINGNSSFFLARGNSYASSSIKYQSLTVNPGATFNLQTAGNTNSAGAITQFQSTVIPGSSASAPVTFNAVEFAETYNTSSKTYIYTTPVPAGFINRNNITASSSFGENFQLGVFADNGNTVNFQSGGYNNQTGTYVQISSSASAPTIATGIWNLGTGGTAYSNVNGTSGTYYSGVELDLLTSSGNVGGITNNTINVNPYSQLFFDGAGILKWGQAGQTINVKGVGIVTDAAANTPTPQTAAGALSFSSDTAATAQNPLQNELLANVVMTGSSVINVTGTVASAAVPTAAQIDGNLTSTNPGFVLTKVGPGALYLSGTGNSWNGGTVINNGSIIVNPGSSLGTAGSLSGYGPLTLASIGGGTSATSTNLTLNGNQTVGSLSSSFNSSTGTASNTITLNGTSNLNIIQTTAGTFGLGALPATLTSSISGTGSISLDSASTAALTLGGPSTYTGGTNVSGGTLLVTNPTGSATGTGPVFINGAKFGGTGIVTGPVTSLNGNLSIGSSIGTSGHLPGLLTLSGGLNLSGGSVAYYLNTVNSSDTISLGSAPLTLSSSSPTTVNLFNLGALDSGTYPLFTYTNSTAPSIAGLSLGTVPAGFNYSFGSSTSELDLFVVAPTPLVWAISGPGAWDTTTPNFNNGSGLVAFSNGKAVRFDDTSGGTSSTVTLASALTPALVTFANNTKSYILSGAGAINGSNTSVIVSGTGTVTMATTNGNGFVGSVAVDGGGTLIAAGDAQLGNLANPISLTSNANFAQPSTFEFSSTNTSNRLVTLFGTGGEVAVLSGQTTTLTGLVVGSGGLVKAGPGTLVLSNASNGYTGATNISGGILQLGASGAIPAFSALNVGTGATLLAGAFNNSVGSIAGAGTIQFSSGAYTLTAGYLNTSTTYSGSIIGPGILNKVGTGTLTLSGTSNFSGGLMDAGGGTVIGSTANTDGKLLDTGGSLGTGPVVIAGGSTLQLTSAMNAFGPSTNGSQGNFTLGVTSGGGTLNAPSGSTISLPALFNASTGSGPLAVIGGTTITSAGYIGKFNSASGVNGQVGTLVGNFSGTITLGNNTDGGDTLIISGVQGNSQFSTGTPSTGTGGFTVNSGSTLWLKGIGDGVAVTTNTATGVTTSTLNGSGSGTLLLNDGSTWMATGNTLYNGGSNTVVDGASVTINVPAATDKLLDNSAWRAAAPVTGSDPGTAASTVTITGNGLVQFASGAITTTTYNGTFVVNMGPTGILLAGQLNGGGGETLNAFGYTATSSSGPGSPITIQGGTLALGADMTNPTDTTQLAVNSFRSPLTFTGNSSLASSGYEYGAGTNASNYFSTTPVTANVAGDITIGSNVTLSVLTYDPVNPSAGARSLNFETQGSGVTGNMTWDDGSVLSVVSGNSSGGSVNFGRVSGTVLVYGAATMQISSGSTVNIGAIPGYTGTIVNGAAVVSGIDPLYDTLRGNAVSIVDNGSIVWAGRTAVDFNSSNGTQAGVKIYHAGMLTINAGDSATLAANSDPYNSSGINLGSTASNRTVLDVTGISLAQTGKLDLKNNDLVIQNGNLSAITALVAQGYAGGTWNGTGGITSSTAAGDSRHLTALGVILNDDGSGNTLHGNFDGVTGSDPNADTDVLVKFTYYGDADLSGVVDGSDYTRIDNGFLSKLSGWSNGDFNYDGIIDGSDYTLIDNAFNVQGASLAAQVALPTSEIAGLNGFAGNTSAVPEPTLMALLSLGSLGLLGRRRKV